jgi:sugar/nucleoside kinase (ribokinase family)
VAHVPRGEALVGAAEYANAAAAISMTRHGAEPSFAHEDEIQRALGASAAR